MVHSKIARQSEHGKKNFTKHKFTIKKVLQKYCIIRQIQRILNNIIGEKQLQYSGRCTVVLGLLYHCIFIAINNDRMKHQI